ncbi:hypothetical protein F2Q70_00001433 [Brassica cretica]|uniref:Uncharacterized protein n=1 Tax=Brassica cretica TaxID=69181 RepID=A0A8S9IVF4_BRACR|nr:hypothetical protein F2Q70_00001433 [Brassica cretica]
MEFLLAKKRRLFVGEETTRVSTVSDTIINDEESLLSPVVMLHRGCREASSGRGTRATGFVVNNKRDQSGLLLSPYVGG